MSISDWSSDVCSSDLRLLFAAALSAGGIAVVDRLWKGYEWRQGQKMTKQEVKDEHKQTDGDPMLKARMRSIARQRIRKRMMAAVPSASVVVVNPTHYEVALRRSAEHTSELQSLMRISYAVFCLTTQTTT